MGVGALIDMERKGCESISHDHDYDQWVTMVGWVDIPYSDWGTLDVGVPSTYLVYYNFYLPRVKFNWSSPIFWSPGATGRPLILNTGSWWVGEGDTEFHSYEMLSFIDRSLTPLCVFKNCWCILNPPAHNYPKHPGHSYPLLICLPNHQFLFKSCRVH